MWTQACEQEEEAAQEARGAKGLKIKAKTTKADGILGRDRVQVTSKLPLTRAGSSRGHGKSPATQVPATVFAIGLEVDSAICLAVVRHLQVVACVFNQPASGGTKTRTQTLHFKRTQAKDKDAASGEAIVNGLLKYRWVASRAQGEALGAELVRNRLLQMPGKCRWADSKKEVAHEEMYFVDHADRWYQGAVS
jgi:hypothetical protein